MSKEMPSAQRKKKPARKTNELPRVNDIKNPRNTRFYVLPSILLLILAGTILSGILPIQQLNPFDDTKEEYKIKISGQAWNFFDDPIIDVLIVPDPNLFGWQDSFVEYVEESFDDWIICIEIFTAEYGYHYLKNIKFNVEVANTNEISTNNYDIIVKWIDQIDEKGAAGAAVVLSNTERRITKATITLPISVIKEEKVYFLSNIDMHNIATDEIGHTLGLGHSSVRDDVLYGYYNFPQAEYCHSTLDIYGLVIIYQYLDDEVFKPPTKLIGFLVESNISYHYMR